MFVEAQKVCCGGLLEQEKPLVCAPINHNVQIPKSHLSQNSCSTKYTNAALIFPVRTQVWLMILNQTAFYLHKLKL